MSEALHHHDDLDDALDIASHANDDQTQADKDAAFEAGRRRAALRVVGPAERAPAAPTPSQPESDRRLRLKAAGVLAGVGLVAGAGVWGHEGISESLSNNGPEFSEETTTYSLQEGEGLWAAANAVERTGAIDTRDIVAHIEADPANIDVLSDGLQVGETLVIPKSVSQ